MSENKRLFVGRKKVADKFTIILDYDDEIGVKENRSGDVIVLKHNDLNAQQFVAQLVVFLNDQNQAIVDLYDGCEYWSDKASERITLLEKENEQLKKDNEHLETCFKMADSTYTILQKQYWNIEIALSKCRKENKNLKKALWESETAYIEETNEFSIDVEKGMGWLKKEFERRYWND